MRDCARENSYGFKFFNPALPGTLSAAFDSSDPPPLFVTIAHKATAPAMASEKP
jgi:hypothetical protein